MSWTWITQVPHPSASNCATLHILVGNDEYLAFVSEETNGFRAMVPNVTVQPRGREAPPYHYTHDTLQEAKDWCVAELVNRRLT